MPEEDYGIVIPEGPINLENPVVQAQGPEGPSSPERPSSNVDEGESAGEEEGKQEKPWSRAEKRIRELNRQKNDAFTRIDALNQTNATLLQQLTQINDKIAKMEQAQSAPKSDWDKYSEKDLLAMEADALNPSSQQHSTALAVQIREELMQRRLNKIQSEMRGERDQHEKIQTQKQRVLQETLSQLPERYRAEIGDESSEIRRRAESYYASYIQSHGKNDVAKNPEFERAAILRAYADVSAQELSRLSQGNGEALRHSQKTKEALSSGAETAVREMVSPKALFAKGKIDEGLAAMPGIKALMQEAESIIRMRPR